MTDKEEARRLGIAIRKKCLDCSGGMINEVKRCPIKDCPLWTFRTEWKEPAPRAKVKGQVSMFS